MHPHRFYLCTAVTNCGRSFSCITASARGPASGKQGDSQMLKTLALAFTTLLIDRFDWFVVGVTLTGAALVVYRYGMPLGGGWGNSAQ